MRKLKLMRILNSPWNMQLEPLIHHVKFLAVALAFPLGMVADQTEIGTRVIPPSQRGYSVESIRESGERGGALAAIGTRFTAEANRQMGDAMELWNAHRWIEAKDAFNLIWREHPDSPWAAEAELHEGCYYKFNGLFDQAEERYVSILAKYPKEYEIRRKVLHYLPDVYAQIGRYEDAIDALSCLSEMPINWQEKQFIENYLRIYGASRSRDQEDRQCGTKALALAMASRNTNGKSLLNVALKSVTERYAWGRQKASHPQGFSLDELAKMCGGQPVRMTLDELRKATQTGAPVMVYLKAPMPAKCWSSLERPKKKDGPGKDEPSGHFVVVETVADTYLDLLDPDGGRSRWPMSLFVYRWAGVSLLLPGQEASELPVLTSEESHQMRGGCCGNPPGDPSDDPCGDDDAGEGSMAGAADCRTCGGGISGGSWLGTLGAPRYSIGMHSVNFRLQDTPMWYPSAKGPSMYILLTHNRVATQRMALYTNVNYCFFGNKWNFNFASHLTETPENNVDIVLPGGRVERFLPSEDSYVPDTVDVWNRNILQRSNAWFILTFRSTQEKWFFTTNTLQQQCLRKIVDSTGNTIWLNYSSVSGRLTNITDAAGRYFNLEYDGQGMVTSITDSLQRTATFDYLNADLISITDMAGLTTQIQYDSASHDVTNIVYPGNKRWQVSYLTGQDAIFPGYDEPFRISVTDPLNAVYEYTFGGFRGAAWIKDKMTNYWTIGLDTILDRSGPAKNVDRIYYRGINVSTNLTGYSGAFPEYEIQSFQWEHRIHDLSANPLEIAYATQPFSSRIGNLVPEEDGGPWGRWTNQVLITNLFDAHNNLLSKTLFTNGTQWVGTWTNWYDDRDNLTGTRNPLNQTNRYGYTDKDWLSEITNALMQVTRFRYESNGNLSQMIDALNRTNRWFYNANGLSTSVQYADGLVINKGYDAIGRMTHVTNTATGLILDLGYEDLDRLEDLTFRHDGTRMQYAYGCCGLESVTDRLNRTTQFWHDQLGRVYAITYPDTTELSFGYNAANQLISITNLVSGTARVKRFEYRSTNGFTRPSRIVSPLQKTVALSNDFRGNLVSRQTARGQTLYAYDVLGRLKSSTRPSNSGTLTLGYDVLGNLKACTNTASTPSSSTVTWSYSHDALNRVTNAVVVVNVSGFSSISYRIAYAYDAVGNLTNRTVTGISGFANVLRSDYQYDMMNRLTNLAARVDGGLLASAIYRYDSAGRLQLKTYGNGDQVGASYDIESRLEWLRWTNNGTQFKKFRYLRDAMGNIKTLETNDQAIRYDYDLKDQLKREQLPDGTVNLWDYDEAGNALVMPGLSGAYYYNADDELDGVSSATTTVTGQVTGGVNNHKWYNTWAECRGVRARVSTNNGQFQLPGVPLTYGENILNVTVTDVSGNSSNKSVMVTKGTSGLTKKFYYDAEGNLTNSVANGTWVYEWDYENRLVRALTNGAVALECWYDGFGRRVAKREIVGGVEKKWLYVWDGWELVAVCDGTGALAEAYARGVGLAGDIGTLAAIQFKTGTYANKVIYTHSNHRGDVILVRDGTSTIASLDYDPYGRLRNPPAAKVSRFLFSSKELDESTGWYYYGYRYYSPSLQRWANRDPLGEADDRNMYRYCASNPMGNIDATGLFISNPYQGITVRLENAMRKVFPDYCVKQVFEEVLEEYGPTGRKRNHEDHSCRAAHCIANCRITRECLGGAALAWSASLFKELFHSSQGKQVDFLSWTSTDSFGHFVASLPFSRWDPSDSPGDMRANAIGRKLAKCKNKSCEALCSGINWK